MAHPLPRAQLIHRPLRQRLPPKQPHQIPLTALGQAGCRPHCGSRQRVFLHLHRRHRHHPLYPHTALHQQSFRHPAIQQKTTLRPLAARLAQPHRASAQTHGRHPAQTALPFPITPCRRLLHDCLRNALPYRSRHPRQLPVSGLPLHIHLPNGHHRTHLPVPRPRTCDEY